MEMITRQLLYFFASFLWGVLLMLVYDFLLALRRKVHHSLWGRLAEDWVFWFLSAILVFQMIFDLNNGILRSFFVISFAGGMAGYRKLVKDRFVRLILAFFYTIFRPYVWIYKKVCKIMEKHTKNP